MDPSVDRSVQAASLVRLALPPLEPLHLDKSRRTQDLAHSTQPIAQLTAPHFPSKEAIGQLSNLSVAEDMARQAQLTQGPPPIAAWQACQGLFLVQAVVASCRPHHKESLARLSEAPSNDMLIDELTKTGGYAKRKLVEVAGTCWAGAGPWSTPADDEDPQSFWEGEDDDSGSVVDGDDDDERPQGRKTGWRKPVIVKVGDSERQQQRSKRRRHEDSRGNASRCYS